ncbi:MAG: hypothetical protein ACPGJR_06030 [Akkermansiaceae bacterium]
MKIISIQSGLLKSYGNGSKKFFAKRQWRTGSYKELVSGLIELGGLESEEDGQADLEKHGGSDKAICVYPSEHFLFWHSFSGRHLKAFLHDE